MGGKTQFNPLQEDVKPEKTKMDLQILLIIVINKMTGVRLTCKDQSHFIPPETNQQ